LNPVTNKTRLQSVVLADDHEIVREGFAVLCESQAGLSVVGQCADGMAALEMIQSLRPDLAILDLHMPKLTGVQVLKRVKEMASATRVIILSIAREENTVIEALHAGADAYLLKDGPGRHLLDAINYIRDGGVYVTPLLRGTKLFTDARNKERDEPLARLSHRESEVFYHLVNGLRAKDIAEVLNISPKTVDTYRASLMRKLSVHDLVGLVKFAIEHHLTTT
jgi:DNA-binding NarL/FixJ family response regulator